MELTKDMEALIHLIARAFGRASGNESPKVHAAVVVEHAKDIAAEDASKAVVAEDASKVVEVQEPKTALPSGDQVPPVAA